MEMEHRDDLMEYRNTHLARKNGFREDAVGGVKSLLESIDEHPFASVIVLVGAAEFGKWVNKTIKCITENGYAVKSKYGSFGKSEDLFQNEEDNDED